MGFMKRAAAAKGGQQGGPVEVGQPAAAPPPSQQHRTGQAAVKQEPRTHAVKAEAGDHKARQQSVPNSWQHQPAQQQQQQQQRSEGTFKLSENITNMKFMQRAQLKRSREAAFDQDEAAKDAAEWVAPKAIHDKGCLILHERDPLPTGVSGRMSFGFGHMHELAKAEEAEREAAAAAAASEAQIKDEEMGGYGFGSGKGWSPGMMRPKDSAQRANKRQKIKKEH